MADVPVNPYPDERDTTDYRISARHAWHIALIFFPIVALLPWSHHLAMALRGQWGETPAARLVSWRPAQGDLLTRLHEVEKATDQAGYAAAIRQTTQSWLTRLVGEGNQKVYVGNGGWLYYQPELTALRGWGPLIREPFSPMKDPSVARLRLAKDIVLEFAAQLKERGIPLLLLPLPVKPMIYPRQLADSLPDEPLYHRDQKALYAELEKAGIDVLDLTPQLYDMKLRGQVFLQQDTHWTPEAMQLAARLVYDHLLKKYPDLVAAEAPIIQPQPFQSGSFGDLVKLLDLRHPENQFAEEEAELFSINGLDPDDDSPIALLGDSFINVFDDPSLGFARRDAPEERLRAGFAQYLALRLRRPLDVYAVNGGGATQARRNFARRADDAVRSKKLVIWAIACRDLLLSPPAARAAGVEWSSVTFNPHRSKEEAATPAPTPSAAAPVVVEATLVEKSRNQELNGTPYIDALHTAVYKVDRVVSGKFDPDVEWQAVQWTFKARKPQPTASVVVGKRYRLTLSPWDGTNAPNLQDDNTTVDEYTAERWFVESIEALP